ncbi:hypothetical protein C453_08118 [Haloferax elongans ATCC BAA-1513]|uniref:Uncharacterized protein n=1 Tax=Haloferax elongans ATCC BAA-1513 TaxID=1230453 RepID=M0HMF5_HALEO|nr:hypothetical protein C453_08118 [Haloferax elongans ATCC BAA-1513]
MTRGYSPPRVEVVKYAIRTNGDPEPVMVKTEMVETEQAKLSDFTESDTQSEVYIPPCLKKQSESGSE